METSTTPTKQAADFLAVNEYLKANPGTPKKAAVAEVAKTTKRSVNTVTANYYREARKQNAPLLKRRPRKTAKAITKTKATKKVVRKPVTPKTAQNLSLNGVRATLKDALTLIDQMERRNAELEKKLALIKSL